MNNGLKSRIHTQLYIFFWMQLLFCLVVINPNKTNSGIFVFLWPTQVQGYTRIRRGCVVKVGEYNYSSLVPILTLGFLKHQCCFECQTYPVLSTILDYRVTDDCFILYTFKNHIFLQISIHNIHSQESPTDDNILSTTVHFSE